MENCVSGLIRPIGRKAINDATIRDKSLKTGKLFDQGIFSELCSSVSGIAVAFSQLGATLLIVSSKGGNYGKEKISFDSSGNFWRRPGCNPGFLAERARGKKRPP
jgi:hypothetical protein